MAISSCGYYFYELKVFGKHFYIHIYLSPKRHILDFGRCEIHTPTLNLALANANSPTIKPSGFQ